MRELQPLYLSLPHLSNNDQIYPSSLAPPSSTIGLFPQKMPLLPPSVREDCPCLIYSLFEIWCSLWSVISRRKVQAFWEQTDEFLDFTSNYFDGYILKKVSRENRQSVSIVFIPMMKTVLNFYCRYTNNYESRYFG